jgi:hypothetical protein
MSIVMSKENLKKFIKKYKEISDCEITPNDSKIGHKKKSAREWLKYDKDISWKQGADELMAALRIDIDYLKKYNELDD